jgi:hypothetical protein
MNEQLEVQIFINYGMQGLVEAYQILGIGAGSSIND